MGFDIEQNYSVNQVNEADFFSDFGEPLQEFEDNSKEETILQLAEKEKKEVVDYYEKSSSQDIAPEEKKSIIKYNEKTSEVIVTLFDKIMSISLGLYSLSDDFEKYSLDKEDFKDIQELVARMLPEDKKVFPLWLQLSITGTTIWGRLMFEAHSERKDTQELEEQKKKNKEHELKIRELEVKLKEKEIDKKEK